MQYCIQNPRTITFRSYLVGLGLFAQQYYLLVIIRANEWGEPQYRTQRISGYLAGQFSPRYALGPRTCYVAVVEGAVVGFVAGHLTRRYACNGELEGLNVIPKSRRMGVASDLLRLMAHRFVEHEEFRICVDVDPNNVIEHWLVWNDISGIVTGK